MKVGRILTAALGLVLMASATPVLAKESASAVKAPRIDLEDLMSSDEIFQELDVTQAELFKAGFWNSGTQNARLQILVDKAEKGTSPTAQTLEAYLDGVLAFKFVVSTGAEKAIITTSGKPSSRRTPTGIFRIYHRNINHVSKTWTDAKMSFAQFFNGGIAIHATTPSHYAALGKRDSGGCVRLRPENAETMWDLVGSVGVKETVVTVYDGSVQAHPLGGGYDQPLLAPKPQMSEPKLDAVIQQRSAGADADAEAVRELNRKMLEEMNHI